MNALDHTSWPTLDELPAKPRLALAASGPGDAAWLAARARGLGGSDVAAAIGHSRWRTPLDVYLAKTEGLTWPQSEPMQWGHRLEPVIADWFAEQTGAQLMPSPGVLAAARAPWMLATVDRFALVGGVLAVLECKASRFGDWDDDAIPIDAETQARWYLAVTGLERAYIAALVGGTRGVWRCVRRDPEIEAWIVSRAEAFWRRVCDHDPPPPQPPRAAAGVVCELDASWHDRLLYRAGSARQAKLAAAQADDIKAELQQLMGEATEAILDGQLVATWRESKPRSGIDEASLKADHPDIAAAYTITHKPARPMRFLGES